MIDVVVPEEQEGTKAVVRSWLRQVGDLVFENEPLVELETDKVTQEVPAPASGVLAEIVLDTDAEAVPGAVLARISAEEESASPQPAEAPPATASEERASASPTLNEVGSSFETRLSPSVRRALQQHAIDASRIQGTGRDGRITREDVDRCVADTCRCG